MQDDFICPSCFGVDNFRKNMLLNGIFIPQSSSVAQYNSFQENSESVETAPPLKRRRLLKDWIYHRTFNNKKEAEEFMKTNWSYHYANKSEKGLRVNYRCPMVKFRGPQCETSAYLLYDATNTTVQLFISDSEHSHDNAPNAVDKIPLEIQEEIKKLFENNVTTPKAMIVNLIKRGIDQPPREKLVTFLKNLKKAKYGEARINCGSLEKWFQENSGLPENESQPFVLNFEKIVRMEPVWIFVFS